MADYTATCHNPACDATGRALELSVPGDLPVPTQGVCGTCEQPLTPDDIEAG